MDRFEQFSFRFGQFGWGTVFHPNFSFSRKVWFSVRFLSSGSDEFQLFFLGNGPVSESAVSNTELSEFLPSFWQNSPGLPQNSVRAQ